MSNSRFEFPSPPVDLNTSAPRTYKEILNDTGKNGILDQALLTKIGLTKPQIEAMMSVPMSMMPREQRQQEPEPTQSLRCILGFPEKVIAPGDAVDVELIASSPLECYRLDVPDRCRDLAVSRFDVGAQRRIQDGCALLSSLGALFDPSIRLKTAEVIKLRIHNHGSVPVMLGGGILAVGAFA